MKLGVFTVLLADKSLDEALQYINGLGAQTVEIGCGGYPGTAHCNAKELIKNEQLFNKFKSSIEKSGLTISALSVHSNPVHPQDDIAQGSREDFEAAVQLANRLGIDRINTFSGCPGDSSKSIYPNWVTCAWPVDYQKILKWQWDEVLIPYWIKAAEYANHNGVDKIALEMHPGFCVYNPYTLLKLRNAVGDIIGANFDPSHLVWQGINPVNAIRALKDCIYHFHAKDTKIDRQNCSINGVLDTKHFSKESERSWIFRTVGYGNDESFWRDIISELRLTGYDYAISIEHEDSLMTPDEGLKKAIEFLKRIVIFDEKLKDMWWA